jgi:hypothetical protein
MTECEQLLMGGIRSVAMGGPAGNMMPTIEGEMQITEIWNTSCAPSQGPWTDEAAFRQAIIDQANVASADIDVAAAFNSAVGTNDARATATFGSFMPAMLICIKLWWFKIYIWRTI